MAFLDEAIITAHSGDGGKGCISFRREKFIPKGGPDGGDGGDGGNIIVRASKKLHSLTDYGARKYIKSQPGRPGGGANKTGRNGKDVILEVPLGTIIYDQESGEIVADLIGENQEILLLRGGIGGKGNRHFATSTHRVPRLSQPGLPGQRQKLRLSLKYIADIGLIGLPNAGKSTLLSSLTGARPQINSYPFTTLTPNLGIILYDDESTLTVADIPGLIEGASEGKGLGHRFLKHVERTKFLLHLIDITYQPADHILEDFYTIRNELERYHLSLLKKKQIVLINKIDAVLPGHRDINEIKKVIIDLGLETFAISALTGEGLDELKQILAGRLLYD